MPVMERRRERLQHYPAALEVVQTAFARQGQCSLNTFLEVLGSLPFVDEPLALDRAGLWPAQAEVPLNSTMTLPVALCYDAWLPAGLHAKLRASVPDAPPGQDRLWQALEAAPLLEMARASLFVPSVASVLGRGVSPEMADEQGRLPMQFAAMQGDVELAGLLLACGADPTVVDDEGDTPLDAAKFAGDDAAAVLSQYRAAE